MHKLIGSIVVGAALLLATPAAAHERDLITAGGKVGPIRTGHTTQAEMKEIWGEPTSRKVVRVGCSRVIRLRWRGEIQTYTYRADEMRTIVDVKVLERTVAVPRSEARYSFHTRKGLRVGDPERRLRELYPNKKGYNHVGHTHYTIGESDRGTRLLAKVVDGEVVQLEAAPYEFC